MIKSFIISFGVLIQFSCIDVSASDHCIDPTIEGYLFYGPLTEELVIDYFEDKTTRVPYSEISEWFISKKKNECIYVFDSPREDWKRLAGRFGLVNTVDGEIVKNKVFIMN